MEQIMRKTKCDFSLKASQWVLARERTRTETGARRMQTSIESWLQGLSTVADFKTMPNCRSLNFLTSSLLLISFRSLKSLKTTLNTREPVKSIKQKARQLCIQDWKRPKLFNVDELCFPCKTIRLNLNFSSRSRRWWNFQRERQKVRTKVKLSNALDEEMKLSFKLLKSEETNISLGNNF